MNTKDLPKDPTAAYALGARDAFDMADNLVQVAGIQQRNTEELRAKLQERRDDAAHRVGPYFRDGAGDRVNKARKMLLTLEMLGLDGLDGACDEAKEGYGYLLRLVNEELEAADETFDGYRERPFSVE